MQTGTGKCILYTPGQLSQSSDSSTCEHHGTASVKTILKILEDQLSSDVSNLTYNKFQH